MRTLVTLFGLISFSLSVFAGNPNGPASTNTSADEEVGLSVERSKTEVLLNLTVKDITQYDHIIVERSADNPNYFGQCKYITCADEKTIDGKINKVDRFPFPATKDVFYRIKTVTKDGIVRAYPAVLLAAQ
ncbi:MAG: hypothetical protein U0V74_10420 [Chitinophagales bacterium]